MSKMSLVTYKKHFCMRKIRQCCYDNKALNVHSLYFIFKTIRLYQLTECHDCLHREFKCWHSSLPHFLVRQVVLGSKFHVMTYFRVVIRVKFGNHGSIFVCDIPICRYKSRTRRNLAGL